MRSWRREYGGGFYGLHDHSIKKKKEIKDLHAWPFLRLRIASCLACLAVYPIFRWCTKSPPSKMPIQLIESSLRIFCLNRGGYTDIYRLRVFTSQNREKRSPTHELGHRGPPRRRRKKDKKGIRCSWHTSKRPTRTPDPIIYHHTSTSSRRISRPGRIQF